jgi:hypothetical protein
VTDLKQQLEQEQQEYQILSQTAAQLREQLSQVGQELFRREGRIGLLQQMMETNGKEEEDGAPD